MKRTGGVIRGFDRIAFVLSIMLAITIGFAFSFEKPSRKNPEYVAWKNTCENRLVELFGRFTDEQKKDFHRKADRRALEAEIRRRVLGHYELINDLGEDRYVGSGTEFELMALEYDEPFHQLMKNRPPMYLYPTLRERVLRGVGLGVAGFVLALICLCGLTRVIKWMADGFRRTK